MRKICIVTFGCQMNKLDSELAAEALQDAGHLVVADESAADTVIFNTCAVRDHAEQRALSRLAQLRTRREADDGFRLGLMGCFAEREGEALLERLPYLDFAVGTRQFMRLPDVLAQAERGRCGRFGEADAPSPGIDGAHPRSRHSGIHGYVSIMRGCANRCAYCAVPGVRGGETCRPAAEAVREVRALAAAGAREVTLLGQNIDAYGKGGEWNLARLLRHIEETVPPDAGIARIRFVTSHPRDITRELAATVAALPRVCGHFHMPAQSGSDRVLRAMRRGYSRAEYEEKLAMIRDVAPTATVASDFIVGFPGETDGDFLATLDLVEKARFQNSYIFKYSPRPGTLAARDLEDDVPGPEKRRRNLALLEAQNAVNRERAAELVGSRQTILVEGVSARDYSRWTGRTAENLICVFPAPGNGGIKAGDLLDLDIYSATPLTLFGRPGRGAASARCG
ncbi:MAG: tRNA (N6-isopentenyl adenosine(37)-C2)-methylthiotransferase MiaB [Planctomycetota bacterium]|jgi:tRNA-2-methylthio-N6-dimethylallyladenosine synthase|nr:tRNA (N6-isopentenyl adenosine(37)-C2)-methylthiotransferase MiaB [Planctomycetota bacterium]